ncbi:MAG: CBS domain-containing protein [Gammaproteobacteria bacterium]|nr:CBS domain-containing protein [Gammaproteobacteria bacterium]
MLVGKVCNRELVAMDKSGDLLAAAKLMREHHVGSVVVTSSDGDGLRPVGMVTDRDLVVEIIAAEVDIQSVSLEDIMTRYPIVAREDDELYDVLESMRTKGVRRVPVLDRKGFVVGVLALDDVLNVLAKELGAIASLIDREKQTEERVRAAL